MEVVILPEIQKRLFPLRPEELQHLRESIEKEGVRDPLVVWPKDGKLILVDGHQRYRICRELGKNFPVVERDFADLDEVLDWVDRNQIARRNLTDEQFAMVIGRIYERRKKAPKGFEDRDLSRAQFEHGDKSAATAKAIASEFDIGQATVRRAADFAKAVQAIERKSPELASRILEGKVPDALSELPKLAKKSELLEVVAEKLSKGEAERVKEALKLAKTEARERRLSEREMEAVSKEAKPWLLLCGDALDAGRQIADESVHAIITDPPYGREHMELYSKLSQLAARVLVPGGVCLVMTGQAHLAEAIQRLSERLTYVWTLAYLTPGPSTQVFGRRIKSNWKPVVYLCKEPLSWEHVNDVIVSGEREKKLHEWEQSESGVAQLVERFTVPGQVVLDPFCGTCTTGVAAVSAGRRFIGIDVDAGLIEKAELRLMNVQTAYGGLRGGVPQHG